MLQAMQSKFPKLIPLKISPRPTVFEGYLSIYGKDYFVCLETPHFPHAKDVTINADIQLLEILQSAKFEHSQKTDTVVQYLKALQDSCESYLKESDAHLPQDLNHDEHLHLTSLLAHIEEIGWDHVSQIFTDFSFIDLIYRDKRTRNHILRLKIPPNYPLQPPTAEVDFPSEFHLCEKNNGSLSSIFERWKQRISTFQPFWDVMDELDDAALVIDPINPSKKHTTRRILLDNHISIHLTVSPEHPLSAPKFHLLGPSSLTTPLNDQLVELYQIWEESESIVYNLEHILKVSVVRKRLEKSNDPEELSVLEEWNVECAVCYLIHFEEQLPDYTCDQCRKSFHLACLYDWLRCLPSSRQSGPFIRGDCPHCTKPISCKVPSQ